MFNNLKAQCRFWAYSLIHKFVQLTMNGNRVIECHMKNTKIVLKGALNAISETERITAKI